MVKKKILIIDDELYNVEYFIKIGSPIGKLIKGLQKTYELEGVCNGEEGIKKAIEGNYSAILIDYIFKGQAMHGPTIAAEIKKAKPDLKLVGFSSLWADEKDAKKHFVFVGDKKEVLENLVKYV